MEIIIWRGNPSSGGTGYGGTGSNLTEAFTASWEATKWSPTKPPATIFGLMARAAAIQLPIVRLGDEDWSIEIRRPMSDRWEPV